MKKSSLRERDNHVIWHPYTQHKSFEGSIPIVKGEGALLFDEQGMSYIDANQQLVGEPARSCAPISRGKSL